MMLVGIGTPYHCLLVIVCRDSIEIDTSKWCADAFCHFCRLEPIGRMMAVDTDTRAEARHVVR